MPVLRRPKSVTGAVILLLTATVGNFVFAGLGVIGEVDEHAGTSTLVGLFGYMLCLAVPGILMAVLTLRGFGAGRVLAFIFCGLATAMWLLMTVLLIIGVSIDSSSPASERALVVILGFWELLQYAGVLVLLAMPSAGRYFRTLSRARRYGMVRSG